MKVDRGVPMDQVETMYKKLLKELDKWIKSQSKMIKRKGKVKFKKDMCNFALIIKVLMQMQIPNAPIK